MFCTTCRSGHTELFHHGSTIADPRLFPIFRYRGNFEEIILLLIIYIHFNSHILHFSINDDHYRVYNDLKSLFFSVRLDLLVRNRFNLIFTNREHSLKYNFFITQLPFIHYPRGRLIFNTFIRLDMNLVNGSNDFMKFSM